jgi:multidrug efflux pump subunit AcrB
MYRIFRTMLKGAIRFRWGVVTIMIAMLFAAALLFGKVDQMFFPQSDRAQFMVDYWMPEGTTIGRTSAGLREMEDHLKRDPRVTAVSTFVGQGPPRFYLPVSPEKPYSSYGQLIVNVPDHLAINALIPDIEKWASDHVPEAQVVVRRYGLGPSETWQVQARFSGPGDADPAVLRQLARQAEAIMRDNLQTKVVRNDWRERTKKLALHYDQQRGRWAGVSRDELAQATSRAFDGVTIGQYRQRDKLMPIILRNTPGERASVAATMGIVQVSQGNRAETLPLTQVTRSIGVEWEDPLVWRWNRRRAITVQAVPTGTAPALHAQVRPLVEAIALPTGYSLEWDGEYKSSLEAQTSLVPGIIPAVAIMAMILVALFNAFRPPLIIACLVPLAMVGVTIGLLATGQPFGFVALLGAMSLSGMMIKNVIVLLDQVNLELAAGSSRYQAVIDSAVSRFRPVMLAAGTTVLGVIPLLQDVFWVSMAVVIMFGLAVGTALTMIGVPVLYACFYRLTPDEPAPHPGRQVAGAAVPAPTPSAS